ncbi:MAG TPA: hypothetical protein VIV40_09880 [Kofleriaceae bacterium]
MNRAACAALAAVLAAGCAGETGTISVSLTTAPGSTLLDTVQTLRMTVTNPMQVFTAERTPSGFAIALELPATGESTSLIVEGLDNAGTLIANGASPHFPIGAINGRVVIYMAPPLSIGAAPLSLTPARSELAIAALPYGAILVGGRLASNAPSDAVTIYNAFDHTLGAGMMMPAPRAGVALGVGTGGAAYMFGGFDDGGSPTANLFRFDTTVAPAGAFSDYGVKEGFARAGQLALQIGNEKFLVTGTPAAEFSGLDGTVVVRDEVPALPAAGVSLTGNDGKLAAIFAGPDSVVRFRENTFTTLPIPTAARADANVVALPGGKVIVVCGSRDADLIDAASGTSERVLVGFQAVAKTGCAAAATSRHLIVVGGTAAGTVDASVEVYDAATLAPLATLSLVVPRTNAVAFALPNDQILIAGGVDASGAPVGTLELFTPPAS